MIFLLVFIFADIPIVNLTFLGPARTSSRTICPRFNCAAQLRNTQKTDLKLRTMALKKNSNVNSHYYSGRLNHDVHTCLDSKRDREFRQLPTDVTGW